MMTTSTKISKVRINEKHNLVYSIDDIPYNTVFKVYGHTVQDRFMFVAAQDGSRAMIVFSHGNGVVLMTNSNLIRDYFTKCGEFELCSCTISIDEV